jgi:hypothetical protein
MRFLLEKSGSDMALWERRSHTGPRPVLTFVLLVAAGALVYSFGLQLLGVAVAAIGVLHMSACRERADLLELKTRLEQIEQQRTCSAAPPTSGA